jgi:hypothetical protein
MTMMMGGSYSHTHIQKTCFTIKQHPLKSCWFCCIHEHRALFINFDSIKPKTEKYHPETLPAPPLWLRGYVAGVMLSGSGDYVNYIQMSLLNVCRMPKQI